MKIMKPSPQDRRPAAAGFTLVELLVSVAIVAVLVAMLVPAVQMARESARGSSCRNNVRQIAAALLQQEQTIGFMPSGGWGPGWLGVAERGSDPSQPGSWIYTVLPGVEAEDVHDLIANATAANYRECAARPVPAFACPSRRTSSPRQLTSGATYLTPFDAKFTMTTGVVSDYAANGGSWATCPPLELLEKAVAYGNSSTNLPYCHVPPGKTEKDGISGNKPMSAILTGHSGDSHADDHIGPCATCGNDMATVASDPASTSQGDEWWQIPIYGRITLPDGGIPDMQDGIVARMSQVRAAMIRDGLSSTYLIGEKYVAADRYATASDAGDDRVMIAGYSSSTVRWAYDPPAMDTKGVSKPNVFGSPHRSGWTAAFADGSVATLGFDIDPAVHQALAGRADSSVVSRPD